MGNLLPSYKKAIFEELLNSITSNTSHYYAFASNPKEYAGNVPENTKDIYSSMFENSWNMIFGKKITPSDIMPVIQKNMWSLGTVYDEYDNNSQTMYDVNNYYAITQPQLVGGDYYVYKCISNANSSPSTVDPQSGSPNKTGNFITTPDGYIWRYVTTISSALYNKFATNDYVPVYTDTTVSTTAVNNSGVDEVLVVNGGQGYSNYDTGVVAQKINSTTLRISGNNTSKTTGFYNDCSIFVRDSGILRTIFQFISNSSGEFVITSTEIPEELSLSGKDYVISPQVVFETDAVTIPQAYSLVNPNTNVISSVVVVSTGANVSWANAHIYSPIYGKDAVLKTVVSPPGGHSGNPEVELNMKGYCVAFNFSNTENQTVVTSNTTYNKIGLIKNPYGINSISSAKTSRYSANTFSCYVQARVNGHTFNKGETVTGSTSGARGTVVFANTSQVYLVGDKDFINEENVSNTTASNVTSITIFSRGDIYTKDITPLYVQNINNVNRQSNQTESFKIIIKI